MPQLESELIKRINRGTCFLLLGSGVSIDEGYPSWKDLCTYFLEYISKNEVIDNFDYKLALKQIEDEDYLDFFDKIEDQISKVRIVDIVRIIFKRITPIRGKLYDYITSWPIPIYLTTNFDSLLLKRLSEKKLNYIEKSNSKVDFRSLNPREKNLIFKIHGDFRDPKKMILTKRDYDATSKNEEFAYWREKLFSLLNLCDIIIIGYSAKDPNFRELLRRAKEFADPQHPIFMFASEITQEEKFQLLTDHNIRIISYSNRDGKHSGLKKLLKQYSTFICRRESPYIGKDEVDPEEATTASAIYFYDDDFFEKNNIITKAYYHSILDLLSDFTKRSEEQIITQLDKKSISTDTAGIATAISDLEKEKYLRKLFEDEELFQISDKGSEFVSSAKQRSINSKERFLLYCHHFLEKNGYTTINIQNIVKQIDTGLTSAFKIRGIEISRMIFNQNQEIDFKTSTDIISEIQNFSTILSDIELDGFTDLLLEILQRPTEEARDYLALLCNGYFIYHVLGHNKAARQNRLQLLTDKDLIIDSSILIPLIAKECINHNYANELLSLLENNKINLVITERILNEVNEHAQWAWKHYKSIHFNDILFYATATGVGGPIKQNLFIDGAINWSSSQSMVFFSDYIRSCLDIHDEITPATILQSIRKIFKQHSISILSMNDFPGFSDNLYAKFEDYSKRIEEGRRKASTYRSRQQCETEAELSTIAVFHPFNFLSHSGILKRIASRREILHWRPETLYRFLKLNDTSVNLTNLYSCMVADFYHSGFRIITREVLDRFCNPQLHQSRLTIREQQRAYGEQLDKYLSEKVVQQHSDDINLPFFALQTAYQIAKKSKEEHDNKDKRIKELEKTKKLTDLERLKLQKYESKARQKKQKTKNKRKHTRKHKSKKKRK